MSLALQPALSRAAVERFHEQSLDLLEQVGIDYKTPQALAILEQAGCPVDYDRTRARLPRTVVEWALQQAPRVVRLAARDPARDVVLDGRRSHHTTDSQGTQVVDLETGEYRASTARDLCRGLLLADALDRIEIVNVMVAATDVPAHVRTLSQIAMALAHTSKPVRSGVLHPDQVPFLVDLVCAALGGGEFRPIFSATDCTISPLMHDGPMTEACIELVQLGVPILIYPMPLAGGTAPLARAGTVLLHNVELLSALTLFQLVRPGAPVIYGTGASQMDMRTGRYGGGAGEYGLKLALCEMARFYHLPSNLWGLSTASAELDARYGHEATASALLAALAGADEIYSAGLLGSAQILSLEKLVLDHHLIRQVEIMTGPFLAADPQVQAGLIAEVGVGGHYLLRRETRSALRQEYVEPWPPAGKTALGVARAEALDLLDRHRPLPLPGGAAEAMDAVLAAAGLALAHHSE
jgi:trimethylamine---corrinoid protein Co-methyltransferase